MNQNVVMIFDVKQMDIAVKDSVVVIGFIVFRSMLRLENAWNEIENKIEATKN